MQQVPFHSLLATPAARRPVVMKFGGTSVADLARIRAVAARALAARALGAQPVVVVSAMAGETDRLLALARSLGPTPDVAEVDALAATGEQATAALTALAIQALGGQSRSFLGHQLQLRTAGPHGDARVRSLDPRPLRLALRRGQIPVVAGFQGVAADGRITTLGRGGSDTTAVAVAAALDAAVCDIYTDVEGVHAADPRVVADARRIHALGYREMHALASRGAKVLHARSVALAERHGVRVRVKSSFKNGSGTLVAGHAEIQDALPTAVAADAGVVLVSLRRAATTGRDRAAAGAGGGEALAEREAHVFSAPSADVAQLRDTLGGREWELVVDVDVAAVSVVGATVANPGAVAKTLAVLAGESITVKHLQLGEQTITCFVPAAAAMQALQALHDAFAKDPQP